jgi:hypothetical protein
MIYVERNDAGEIIALHKRSTNSATEQKQLSDPEVIAFLESNHDAGPIKTLLSATDPGMIRVIDDLVDVLVTKKIIKFTDLPDEAQQKLFNRKKVRSDLSKDTIIMDDEGIL